MMTVSRMFCREEPRSLIFLCLVYEVVWGKLVPYIDWYGPSLHTDMLDVSRRGVEEVLYYGRIIAMVALFEGLVCFTLKASVLYRPAYFVTYFIFFVFSEECFYGL